MTLTPDQVRHHGMTENLGTDVVAVDAQGNVLGRADTREAAERASPDAVAFFTAKDFESTPTAAAPAPASADHNDAFDKILAQVDPAVLKDYLPAEPEAKAAEPPPANEDAVIAAEGERPEAEKEKPVDGSAFDHDGDGRVGGSKPKASRQRKPA